MCERHRKRRKIKKVQEKLSGDSEHFIVRQQYRRVDENLFGQAERT